MKKILNLTFLLSTVACSTASKPAAIVENAELAKPYKKSIEYVYLDNVKSGQCSKGYGQIKSTWNWKQAVDAAGFCVKTGDWSKVKEIADELSAREPHAPWGPFYLGLIAKENKQLDRALWMSELAIKRMPEYGLNHYLKGQILWEMKEFGAAVSSMEKALQFEPALMPAHLFLGQIYFKDQDFNKAKEHFSAVLRQQPKNAIALAGLSESQTRIQKGG